MRHLVPRVLLVQEPAISRWVRLERQSEVAAANTKDLRPQNHLLLLREIARGACSSTSSACSAARLPGDRLRTCGLLGDWRAFLILGFVNTFHRRISTA